MKHIINQNKFDNADVYSLIQVKCINCSNTFYRKKRDILNTFRKGREGTRCEECQHPRKTVNCLQCKKGFIVYPSSSQQFCNRSCATSYNNTRKEKKPKTACKCCGQLVEKRNNKFCSAKCMGEYTNKISTEKNIKLLKEGKLPDTNRGGIKKTLIALGVPERCNVCGVSEWQGQKLPLILDHIDGKATNNKMENLQLLCSNCDSISPTYKAKNKGNGRKSLGLL